MAEAAWNCIEHVKPRSWFPVELAAQRADASWRRRLRTHGSCGWRHSPKCRHEHRLRQDPRFTVTQPTPATFR